MRNKSKSKILLPKVEALWQEMRGRVWLHFSHVLHLTLEELSYALGQKIKCSILQQYHLSPLCGFKNVNKIAFCNGIHEGHIHSLCKNSKCHLTHHWLNR